MRTLNRPEPQGEPVQARIPPTHVRRGFDRLALLKVLEQQDFSTRNAAICTGTHSTDTYPTWIRWPSSAEGGRAAGF